MNEMATADAQRSFFTELLARRVPQLLGVYIGAIWIAVEFTNFVVDRYLLSSHWVDMALLGLLTMLPAVLILAWNHGAPGRDAWTKTDLFGVGINVVVTTVLVLTTFHGRPLGATAERIEMMSEAGEMISREVPKADLHSQILVFFFNPEPGGEADWQSYAASELLATDLNQDRFIAAQHLLQRQTSWLSDQLLRAGYRDAVGVPTTLAQRVAARAAVDYFIVGSIDNGTDDSDVRVVAELFRVSPTRSLTEVTAKAPTLTAAIDGITGQIRIQLADDGGALEAGNDLPVASLFSENETALRHYTNAGRARMLENDLATETESLQSAVAADPSFARAYLALAMLAEDRSDFAGISAWLANLAPHNYRLIEGERMMARVLSAVASRDQGAELEALEQWVTLYPESIAARGSYANALVLAGELDEARRQYHKLQDLQPSLTEILGSIAMVDLALGDRASAKAHFQQLLAENPDNVSAGVNLAWLESQEMNVDEARRILERAAVLNPDFVMPLIERAKLELLISGVEEAFSYLDQAEAVARDASQQSVIELLRAEFLYRTGQLDESLTAYREGERLAKRSETPIDAAYRTLTTHVPLLVDTQGIAATRDELDAFDATFGTANNMTTWGRAWVEMKDGNLEAAAQHIQSFAQFVEQDQREDLRYHVAWLEAELLAAEADYSGAADGFATAAVQLTRSPLVWKTAELRLVQDLRVRRAEMLRLAADATAAQRLITEVLEVAPAHPQAHLEAAQLAKSLGNDQIVTRHLKRVAALCEGADADSDVRTILNSLYGEVTTAVES